MVRLTAAATTISNADVLSKKNDGWRRVSRAFWSASCFRARVRRKCQQLFFRNSSRPRISSTFDDGDEEAQRSVPYAKPKIAS